LNGFYGAKTKHRQQLTLMVVPVLNIIIGADLQIDGEKGY
jgi:hypothetical protein